VRLKYFSLLCILIVKHINSLKITEQKQKTLKKAVSYSGFGIHTGNKVSINLLPGEVDQGIVFVRTDLPGKPRVQASIHYVQEGMRNTSLASGKAIVHTVEHLLAALYALEVNNAIIEIDAEEVPIADGGAQEFVRLINEVTVIEQEGFCREVVIDKPLFFREGDSTIIALPFQGLKISYTLNYPQKGFLSNQYSCFEISKKTFIEEIAPCRTFCQKQELDYLLEKGLIKGGSLENALVINGDLVLNKGGLHFPDEMPRHKILDVIGDLSLLEVRISAHIIAIKTGHRANAEMAKNIFKAHLRGVEHVI
jgi:UDP-3-O-[3-hydroxymyristoyl] N-acetylglucosamine deacetylase